jgi:ABC-type Zn uptake system ZnuABC Zn-binding protein ZnuA
MMKDRDIKIILAADYFDEHKIRTIAAKVGAEPVIVTSYVGGHDNAGDYFALMDMWVDSLIAAAHKSGLIK